VAILKDKGIPVEERDMTYGELIDKVQSDDIVTICSVGTAGILNRCEKLLLVDHEGKILATHEADKDHELFWQLGETRTHYWNIFQGKVQIPSGVRLHKYVL
jgi:hypothetical protein